MPYKELFEVDLVSAREPEPGAGYVLAISNVAEHVFKNGTPAMKITFDVVGAAEGVHLPAGATVIETFAIKGRGVYFLKPLLDALKLESVAGKLCVSPEQMEGRRVRADLAREDFNGVPRLRARNFSAVDG